MKIFKKLNQVGASHLLVLAVVVVALGAGGTYMLVKSHAQTPAKKVGSSGTELYFYNDYTELNAQSGVQVVADFMGMVGASGPQIQVMQIAPGGYLSFGGKGGVIDNAPSITSGKECFVLRSVGGAGSVNIPSFSGGSQTFSLKAAPTPDYGSSYWQYICEPFTSYTTSVPYNIKNVGTTSVNVYQQQLHNIYNY